MRIITLNVKDSVKIKMTEFTEQFGFEDAGFAIDLFCLLRLKGSGIPTDERMTKLIEAVSKSSKMSKLLVGMLMRKRRQQLNEIVKTAPFRGAIPMDPVYGVQQILTVLFSAHIATKAAKCVSCKLLNACNLGKRHQHWARDTSEIIDANWEKDIHPNCPERQSFEATDPVASAISVMQQFQKGSDLSASVSLDGSNRELKEKLDKLAKADSVAKKEASKASRDDTEVAFDVESLHDESATDQLPQAPMQSGDKAGQKFNTAFTNSGFKMFNYHIDTLKKLSKSKLPLFELGQKLDFIMTKHRKGKYKPTNTVEDERDSENIEKASDLAKLKSSSQALPSELKNRKLADKSLQKKQNLKATQKKMLVYLLIDGSGSMTAAVPGVFANRWSLACVMVYTMAMHLKREGGILLYRVYSSSVLGLHKAEAPTEFETMMRMPLPFPNGGTDSESALLTAADDIASFKDRLKESEVLMISDGYSGINVNQVKNSYAKLPHKNKIHLLDVSGEPNNISNVFKSFVDKYMVVDSDAVRDPSKFLKIV